MMEKTAKPTLYLIDGSNYLFRAFYAIRELSNSQGFATNAIYGFTIMLLKLLREYDPQYIVVTFDVKGPTFRHDTYDGYKATRKAPPEAIIAQIPCVKEIVRGLGILVLEQQGIEADDIIGTLTNAYAGRDFQVVIASGDKDLMQLVSDHTVLFDTMKDKRYDAAAVRERFGVEPAQVADILALAGDASDNIPGVPGIGLKGAERLIQEFGSVENLLRNVEKIKNGRARAAMREHADQARMSLDLARLRLDADIPFQIDDSRRRSPDVEALKRLFGKFEFSSLLQELKISDEALAGDYQLIRDESDLRACLEKVRARGALAIEFVPTSPEPMRADVVGVALGIVPGEAWYVPLGPDSGPPSPQGAISLRSEVAWHMLSPVLADEHIAKHGHDLKTAHVIVNRKGMDLRGLGCDTMLAAYVLNPSRRSFELTDILRDYVGRSIASTKDSAASEVRPPALENATVVPGAAYACGRADAVLNLVGELLPALVRDGLDILLRDLEMPLLPILGDMERHGVLLDCELLMAMSRELRQLMELSMNKIYELAGERFNINSAKQLQVILFEKMNLPRGRRTKEGYSTDVDVLTQLAKNHELPGEILAYRSLAKLKSTYIDTLPLLVHRETGRIHTSYNQAVTATGRLSSSNPNLQNIPVRTLEGKRIRQAFIVPEDHWMIAADYSQIELRVLAHLAEDRTLLSAFASGEDIHSRTASTIFGVFPEMVNKEMRRQAKVINFGILYGMSAFGLAKELDVSQKLAQAYIDEYFQKYEGVRAYLDRTLAQARRDGYVTTILNRRRYLPEINAENANVRQFAERTAINTPIQGSAADLIKMAMIRIDRRIGEEGLRARMIMQVHDELVLEVPDGERQAVIDLVRGEMENIMHLLVPLKVDIGCGKNWDEAHS